LFAEGYAATCKIAEMDPFAFFVIDPDLALRLSSSVCIIVPLRF
jgi:hypothetical protein